MDLNQAVAIVLSYDVFPMSYLNKPENQHKKAALAAAHVVIADYAHRAVSEFVGHESSKKYLKPEVVPVVNDVVTINEDAHGH